MLTKILKILAIITLVVILGFMGLCTMASIDLAKNTEKEMETLRNCERLYGSMEKCLEQRRMWGF